MPQSSAQHLYLRYCTWGKKTPEQGCTVELICCVCPNRGTCVNAETLTVQLISQLHSEFHVDAPTMKKLQAATYFHLPSGIGKSAAA